MYIPYFFSDEDKHTVINCRNIENGEHKTFLLDHRPWLIVRPFRYHHGTEEETIDSLRRVFKTNFVEKKDDYYLLSNYDSHDYIENDYKEVIPLPRNYTTKIVFAKKRYYNLFRGDGEWTDEKGHDYPDMAKYHLFLTEDSNGNVMYKKASEPRFQMLTEVVWETLSLEVDIIFTTIRPEKFEFNLPDSTDYAWISPYWREGIENMDYWYEKNKKNLYLLSYMSSRNLSDVLAVNTREEWGILTDDIFLSTDTGMYGKARVNRYNRNFSIPGKYRKVYVYNLGDILLSKMTDLPDKHTDKAYSLFKHLTDFPYIISSLYNSEAINPGSFTVPESCVYLNEKYMFTLKPLYQFEPVKNYEYIIILGEGSYLTFMTKTQECDFVGQHPLCKPLFSAAKKAIKTYMMWDSQNNNANISIIANMIDKTEETLAIPVVINQYNYKRYYEIIPDHIKEDFKTHKIKEFNTRYWLTDTGVASLYDPIEVDRQSYAYIYDLLKQLDNIKRVYIDR